MFKFPSIKVTRVNLKPLGARSDLLGVDTKRILQQLQAEVLKSIRHKILQEAFSHRAKQALQDGFSIKVGPKSITVVAKHPAFRPLLEGRKARQMTWLTKAKKPIPIITDKGELIFRSATPRSMENGSWYHPGSKPTTVIERATKEAKAVMRTKIKKQLSAQLRHAVSKIGK